MSRILPRSEELVVASHNEGKVRELAALFAPFVARVRSAAELGLGAPEEIGDTFRENAAIKARAAAIEAGRASVADDSGLVVRALGGAPGVHSARWEGRDFSAAMARIHRELGDRDRTAEMVTALAIAWPDGHVEAFEGRVSGRLVWPPRGALGFGYEPMFEPLGHARTYGEMPRDEKERDDARARAFEELRAACLQSAQ
jgi:XTP/dITP diphosphohydrolase